ncbi:Microtubule-actin cross-linking factor 1, isoforms 1/2/3/5 [Frankliniella fusca]|uniref:Microtubule-actin cross-linking factor 1, isoforms 1/2/3/5 n=1 Tax=Frankliniella fusca TaxID=407009 RepID=A0AAE1LT43_9NEOP|nr:Microtubule-actin cross-linking factor 1, isoforms 1/2/3/5 [Frankliniella fusca]
MPIPTTHRPGWRRSTVRGMRTTATTRAAAASRPGGAAASRPGRAASAQHSSCLPSLLLVRLKGCSSRMAA